MKLKQLLKIHDRYASTGSLKGNLGDGYLVRHNRMYRSIRVAAVKAGFRFRNDRFYDYDVLALTQLPKIISKKIIPYGNNVRPLRQIEKSAPGVFDLAQVPPLTANYVLHESAHGVGNQIRMATVGKRKDENEKVLCILLEEAFANACESFFSLFATAAVHNLFLMKNSYIVESLETRVQIQKTLKIIDEMAVFRLVIFSYLHANFLKTKISDPAFRRALKIAIQDHAVSHALTQGEVSQLKRVFEGGFDLDPAFTVRTNSFCLRLMGLKRPLQQLLDFDFMKYFETDPTYQGCIKKMSEVLE